MRIRLTRQNDQRHELAVERDGRWESVELETRSTLVHDLTHLAVEQAAGIEHGFFGSLAAGQSFAELAGDRSDGRPRYPGAKMEVERAVAVLQHLAKVDEEPAALHARVVASLAVQDAVPPPWFTVELVADVRERLRRLLGHWRATPFGGVMELEWTGELKLREPPPQGSEK